MNPFIYGRAVRLALAPGLVAGWLMLPATALGFGDIKPPSAPAQADATPVEKPVSFSTEQADRGEELFLKNCEDCHGADLKGGLNGGAPLRGVQFEETFANGAPASGLFLFMSTMMPPDSPGRFSASTYADLMAYILKRNGFQPGAPLPSDIDALDYLIVEK